MPQSSSNLSGEGEEEPPLGCSFTCSDDALPFISRFLTICLISIPLPYASAPGARPPFPEQPTQLGRMYGVLTGGRASITEPPVGL